MERLEDDGRSEVGGGALMNPGSSWCLVIPLNSENEARLYGGIGSLTCIGALEAVEDGREVRLDSCGRTWLLTCIEAAETREDGKGI